MENLDFTKPKIIKLPRITDPRGNLTFAQSSIELPFDLQRAYWIYDVPAGAERGGHSHRQMAQVLVAVAGSFTVNISDGFTWKTFLLNRPFEGLLIPPGYWRTIDDFSSGGVCLSLVSTKFAESDYIREFDEYVKVAKQRGPLL
jgi:hypothetical protein